mgnify:CR=1 FL=1
MSALNEMKARAAAAAEGPWQMSTFVQNGQRHFQVEQQRGPATIARPYREEDAVFISHTPEDQAKLIGVVEEIQTVKRFDEQDRAVIISSGNEQRTVLKSAEFAAGYDEALREIRALITAALG